VSGLNKNGADHETQRLKKLNLSNQAKTIKINCFYNRPLAPCRFTADQESMMENHYAQKHYAQPKEVYD